jgi:hypothetical protein
MKLEIPEFEASEQREKIVKKILKKFRLEGDLQNLIYARIDSSAIGK